MANNHVTWIQLWMVAAASVAASWALNIFILVMHSNHPHVGVSASKEDLTRIEKRVDKIHDHIFHD